MRFFKRSNLCRKPQCSWGQFISKDLQVLIWHNLCFNWHMTVHFTIWQQCYFPNDVVDLLYEFYCSRDCLWHNKIKAVSESMNPLITTVVRAVYTNKTNIEGPPWSTYKAFITKHWFARVKGAVAVALCFVHNQFMSADSTMADYMHFV